MRRPSDWPRSAAVNVEFEILVVYRFVLAVGADRIDGRIQLADQFGFALADGYADPWPMNLGNRRYRADQLAAGTIGRFEPLLQNEDVVIYRVEPAAGQVQQKFLAARIPLDLALRVSGGRVVEMRGRRCGADRLACKVFLGDTLDVGILWRGDGRRRVV